jgi:amidase
MTWPRIETEASMITLVSGKPLDWCARQAFRELLEWVLEDYEIGREQAALLMAMVAHAGICQISNDDYTAFCVAPRDVWDAYRRER